MLYLLLFLSAYFLYKEVKSQRNKRRIVFAYASMFAIAIVYNIGEFVGEGIYLLGLHL